MLAPLSHHLRQHVVGYLALFVALGGTSYAAVRLPAGSVGTRQLRSGAVTSRKVRAHTLLARDFAAGQLPVGPRGAVGPQGATGPKGENGAPGANGTSGTNGAPGTNGTNGKTVLNGSGAPDQTLGADGDFYIDTSTNAIYGPKSSGSWGSATSLVGPSGATNKTIKSATDVAPASGDKSIVATCPSGEKAVGGGFAAVSILQVTGSYPVSGAESWEVDVHDPSTTTSGQAFAYAVCVSP